MKPSTWLLTLLSAATSYAAPSEASGAPASWPARYRDASSGAPFFLYALGGRPNYELIPIQAIDGQLVEALTQKPNVVCPCSSDFGAKNYTGYWYGTNSATDQNAGFQLFTKSLGEQTIYVDTDLQVKFTLPGIPIPPGANSSSITFYFNDPVGSPGLGSPVYLEIQGHVTQLDGTKTYYNTLQLCPPSSLDFGVQSGGNLLYAIEVPADNQGADPPAKAGCTQGSVFTSTDTPAAAPYYFAFYAPGEPLVTAYL